MSIWDELDSGKPLDPPAFRHSSPKTHCKYGHELTPDNIYITKTDEWRSRRECKQCSKRRYQEWAARRRTKLANDA